MAEEKNGKAAALRTIEDFGEQWRAFPDNTGYYGEQELFDDILKPFLTPEDVVGRRVADIGSGSGRIVKMLLSAGVAHVVAIEPSAAFEVLRKNTESESSRISYLRATGEGIGEYRDLDYIFSIGVLHHIPDPLPTLQASYRALRAGGSLLIWVYGKEGNRLYLCLAEALRVVTVRIPHRALTIVSWVLAPLLAGYIRLCRGIRLPMHRYMTQVLDNLTLSQLRLNIYDQLNPAFAKYYLREELEALLNAAGFQDPELFHRHGYSWTVRARK